MNKAPIYYPSTIWVLKQFNQLTIRKLRKIHVLILLLLSLPIFAFSQTMRWIPLADDEQKGKCWSQSDVEVGTLCYALEYQPNESGILTSYTTGFFIDCLDGNSVITYNASCLLKDNSQELDGCESMGQILLNASAHSGNSVKIEKEIPIILHQVCFQIPKGKSVTILEDEITNLTTAIMNEKNGQMKSEFPSFRLYELGNTKDMK